MKPARERAQALIGEGRLYGPVNLNTLTEAIEDAEARGFQAGQEAMRERVVDLIGDRDLINALPVVPK